MNKLQSIKQNNRIEKYYKFQSKIYDSTRWAFLYGRKKIINQLPIPRDAKIEILEIGCGTGHNLLELYNHFIDSNITGIDISKEMIIKSKEKFSNKNGRINLIHGQANSDVIDKKFDLVLISYCLSMINPGYLEMIKTAKHFMKNGAIIAIVDFHDSKFNLFKEHMSNHHVRMDQHLLPILKDDFESLSIEITDAYMGLWQYFTFVGMNPFFL